MFAAQRSITLPGVGILSFLRRPEKRAARLYSEARDLIDAGRFEAALVFARKLRKISYSGAFEIEGLAYAGLDRHEDAVRVLREGLLHAPDVWLNWHLLGNCLSELGRYDEALAAFDRAAACPDVDLSYVNLNRAIVGNRRGDYSRALDWLSEVYGEDTRNPEIAARLSALRGLGRDDEALDLGERALREWTDTGRENDQKAIAAIAVNVAGIRRQRGDPPLAIRAFALRYWRATREPDLLWLIRDVMPQSSPAARYFRLIVHAEDLPGVSGGFYVSIDAVADSVEDAMRLARELDDFDGAAKVTVQDATDLEPRPDEPKGVYAMGGRAYYREE